MSLRETIRTLLLFMGWIFGGTAAGALAGTALLVLVMTMSKSEAIGQGMILLISGTILVPVGACVGFTRALFAWEKRNSLRQENAELLSNVIPRNARLPVLLRRTSIPIKIASAVPVETLKTKWFTQGLFSR